MLHKKSHNSTCGMHGTNPNFCEAAKINLRFLTAYEWIHLQCLQHFEMQSMSLLLEVWIYAPRKNFET